MTSPSSVGSSLDIAAAATSTCPRAASHPRRSSGMSRSAHLQRRFAPFTLRSGIFCPRVREASKTFPLNGNKSDRRQSSFVGPAFDSRPFPSSHSWLSEKSFAVKNSHEPTLVAKISNVVGRQTVNFVEKFFRLKKRKIVTCAYIKAFSNLCLWEQKKDSDLDLRKRRKSRRIKDEM